MRVCYFICRFIKTDESPLPVTVNLQKILLLTALQQGIQHILSENEPVKDMKKDMSLFDQTVF